MTTQNSDTIEIGHVVRAVMRGWRAIVAFTAFGIVAAILLIEFAPRKFTGQATVVMKSTGGGGGGGGGASLLSQVGGLSDLTGMLSGKSPIETEVEIIRSRAVIGQVIDSLRMQAKLVGDEPFAARPVIAALDASGSFAPSKFEFTRAAGSKDYTVAGAATGRMTPGAPLKLPMGSVTFASDAQLPAHFTMLLRDPIDAMLWVKRHLEVEKDKGEIASITYKGDDSLTAAVFTNTLLNVYLARRKTEDRGINQRRVELLTAKNDSMERAILAAGNALRKAQEASGVVEPMVAAQTDFQSRAVLRSRLIDVDVERGALSQLIDQIKAKTASPRDLAAYPRFVGSPFINNIVSQISGYESDLTRLLTVGNKAESSEEVIAVRKNIAAAEAKLLPYAETYTASLERERKDLQANYDVVNRRIEALPAAAESSQQLQRDILDLSKLSAALQAQIVEAKLAAIGEGGDVRPLDLAVVPRTPSFPNRMITLAVGIAGGLFFGIIAALIFGSMGRWVRDPFDVERSTGVPALEFDPAVPLLVSNGARTIVVAPIASGVSVTQVVNRLAHTAGSRSLRAAVLDLPESYADVNGSIARLEAEKDLVIVQLPSLVSDTAAAALQHTRPVLLVAPARRIERRQLVGAVQMLKRLEVPVAGIVMSNGVNGDRTLPR
jgi:tyrosine-protein kinase Etk/Wzc